MTSLGNWWFHHTANQVARGWLLSHLRESRSNSLALVCSLFIAHLLLQDFLQMLSRIGLEHLHLAHILAEGDRFGRLNLVCCPSAVMRLHRVFLLQLLGVLFFLRHVTDPIEILPVELVLLQ